MKFPSKMFHVVGSHASLLANINLLKAQIQQNLHQIELHKAQGNTREVERLQKLNIFLTEHIISSSQGLVGSNPQQLIKVRVLYSRFALFRSGLLFVGPGRVHRRSFKALAAILRKLWNKTCFRSPFPCKWY